jgi:hypothetical protein
MYVEGPVKTETYYCSDITLELSSDKKEINVVSALILLCPDVQGSVGDSIQIDLPFQAVNNGPKTYSARCSSKANDTKDADFSKIDFHDPRAVCSRVCEANERARYVVVAPLQFDCAHTDM